MRNHHSAPARGARTTALRLLLALALAATAACTDATAPGTAPLANRWSLQGASSSTTETGTDTSSAELTPLRLASWAPPLETYDTTFLAVQGRASTHALYFEKQSWQPTRLKYMELSIPPGAQFVDASGNPVAKGTVVPITVHADSGVVRFEFGPHGSSFSLRKPATLSVWWLFADLGSLSGAGLNVWYQPNCSESWNQLDTQVDVQGGYLTAPIHHFSNYAVAW